MPCLFGGGQELLLLLGGVRPEMTMEEAVGRREGRRGRAAGGHRSSCGEVGSFRGAAPRQGGDHLTLADTPEQRRPAGASLGNAEAIKHVLAGEKNAFRDIVILNSAAALMVAGKAKDLKDGAALAAQSIDSGKAAHALATLQRICA